jgi:hypothetical protein
MCLACSKLWHQRGAFLKHTGDVLVTNPVRAMDLAKAMSGNVFFAHAKKKASVFHEHSSGSSRVNRRSVYLSPAFEEKLDLGSPISSVLKDSDVVSLKVESFGLSTSLQNLMEISSERSKDKRPRSFLITFDCRDQTLRAIDKGGTSSMEFSRKFSALSSGKVSTVDSRHVTIGFKLMNLTLDLYASNGAEASLIATYVNQLRRNENISFAIEEENPEEDAKFPIFQLQVFKTGKLKSSQRWLIVKQELLEVLYNREDPIPANSLGLVGVPIYRVEKKLVTIEGPSRTFTFRLDSQYERDTLVSALVEASGAVDGPGPMTLVRKKLSVTSHEAEEPLSKASSGNLEELRSDDYFDKEIGYRSIYCLTKLLRQSIDGSANLTPSLRIPKEIW